MRIIVAILIFVASLEATDARDILHRYLWKKRVVVIFSPALDTPLLKEQQRLIEENKAGIMERDIVIILVTPQTVSLDHSPLPDVTAQSFYKKFKVNKNDFSVILVGKDGGQKLRKDQKIMSRAELFPLIDSMPMRQREMREQKS